MSTTLICIIIFLFMIISFFLNKIPMALTAVISMFFLVITGCVEFVDAFGTLSSPTVVMMASMFIIAAGFNKTQMVHHISKLVYKVSKGSFIKAIAGYILATFILGQFIPSIIALFALVCPLVLNMCKEMEISPSKMVYPIGLISISCSFAILPIGPYAGGYIENNGLLESFNYGQYQFGAWSQSIVKIPVAIIVILFAIFLLPKLTPNNIVMPTEAIENQTTNKPQLLSKSQEIIGYVVFIFVILGLSFQNIINKYIYFPSWFLPMAGAIVIVTSGILNQKEAINNMNLDIILLYTGVASLGIGLSNTGAGEIIGNAAANLLGNTTNSYIIGAVFFITAYILTSFLYNRAVSQILIPIAILTCMSLNCDPRGPITICYIGSMASSITPMSTAVVPMIMSAGGYDQKDMIKMGIFPAIIIGISSVFIGMTLYPAF